MKYAVLLRGVNVGGANRVAMAALRQVLSNLGCTAIQTYIQSGNIVLQSELHEESLCEQIHNAIADAFGFSCGVAARDLASMQSIVNCSFFAGNQAIPVGSEDQGVEHAYVYFLKDSPKQRDFDALKREMEDGDQLFAGTREVFLYCKRSVRLSKTAIRLAKVFPDATARNWRTVGKLYDMLSEA